MNITDFLNKKVQFSEDKTPKQLKNIHNLTAFKEDEMDLEFQDPDQDSTNQDFGGDLGGSDDMNLDFSDDGDFGDMGGDPDGQGREKLSTDTLEFLENIEDSEVPLNEKLAVAYSTLYSDQKIVYDRLINDNYQSSEQNESIADLRKQYKLTLEILKNYILSKFSDDTTVSRVTTLIDFKFKFNRLNSILNDILDKINK